MWFKTMMVLAVIMILPRLVQAEPIHLKGVGFATPESVEYEGDSDTYLVTNINGNPFEKDDNGFISKISPDGTVLELKWIDGASDDIRLNSPKGIVVQNGKIYVTDIDRIRVFDLTTKVQFPDIIFPGSSFISSLCSAGDGGLYVIDSGIAPGFQFSGTDAIYHVSSKGKIKKLKSRELGNPNGIYFDGLKLWMVSMGSGQLRVMNEKGKESVLVTLPYNRLDGLIVTNDEHVITSSWTGNGVYEITPNYNLELVIGGLNSPADLGYDFKRNRILIPLFAKNEVIIYPRD